MSNGELVKRLEKIEARNARVETDKAWETSWTRRISITVLTYIFVLLYLFFIGNKDPWINAVVPAAGFLLSTLAVSRIKEIWRNNANR